MKAGCTIQALGEEIFRQSKAKEDYQINTDAMEMKVSNNIPMLHLIDDAGEDRIAPLAIRATAHSQIGDYLNIPRKYYNRMLTEDADLLAYNVNSWLHRQPEQRILRTMDGQARAFLSSRYRRIDNLDIARITLPIIKEMPEAYYESCQLTEDYMYIKVVNRRLTAEVVPGDIVQAGVIIRNSETGLGAVSVEPLVYRLVCSNGMVVNDARTRRNHIGRVNTSDDSFLIYSQETLAADDKAFAMKLQDTVRAAVDQAKFARVVDTMREAKDAKLNTQDLPAVVKLASSSFAITEDESKGVLQHLITDADYSLFGLANAITRHSQDVENYDRATKLEEIGYSVLTMSPKLFQHINNVTDVPTRLAA